jgi:hypothetical protein
MRRKMALSCLRVVIRPNYVRRNYGVFGVQLCNQYSTAAHTLRVNQQIKEKRKRALLGGGENRIDAQHKKVLE